MNNRFRNWSDLRVFLAVMRHGSTLAASRHLDIAQPTVARRIDALEHELGLTLFDRDTRGFRPTSTAKSLLPMAEAMETAAEDIATHAADQTRLRPIRITAYSANFSPRITKVFSDFSVENPNIPLEFLPTVKTLDLMAGEADIALRITRSPPHPDLICRHVSTARSTLYGSRDYGEKHGLPTSPDDLKGHRFVTFKRDGVPPAIHEWITARVSRDQITSVFSEVEMMDAAIRSGLALGISNMRLAHDNPDLIPCFDPPPELDAEHMILISPEAYRRPEVRTFLKFFAPRYAAIFKPPSK